MPIKKSNIKQEDKNLMQIWGRYFARDNDRAALDSAAEYYACSANADEAAALFFWWEEGVRNNAGFQYDIDMCHAALHARTKELFREQTPAHILERLEKQREAFRKQYFSEVA